MHETHLLDKIFRYLEEEEKLNSKRIKRISIAFSEFGGISEEHFKEHFKQESAGTRWESLGLEIIKVAYGPEIEIRKLYFK